MPDPDHSTETGPLGTATLAECPHCGTRVLPLPGRYCPACRRDLDSAPGRRVAVESAEVLVAGRKMARRLFRDGLSVAEVRQNLIDRGIHPQAAAAVVRDAGAEHVAWYRDRGERAIQVGIHCAVVAAFFAAAALVIWRDPLNHLMLPAAFALAISSAMIAHGVRLRRRAAEFDPPQTPAMKSSPGPVDRRDGSLD